MTQIYSTALSWTLSAVIAASYPIWLDALQHYARRCECELTADAGGALKFVLAETFGWMLFTAITVMKACHCKRMSERK